MKTAAVLALAFAYMAALATAADPPTGAGAVNAAAPKEDDGPDAEAVAMESAEYSHNNWGGDHGNKWYGRGGYGGGGGRGGHRQLDEAEKAEAAEDSHGWNGNGNRNWGGHGGGGGGYHNGRWSS